MRFCSLGCKQGGRFGGTTTPTTFLTSFQSSHISLLNLFLVLFSMNSSKHAIVLAILLANTACNVPIIMLILFLFCGLEKPVARWKTCRRLSPRARNSSPPGRQLCQFFKAALSVSLGALMHSVWKYAKTDSLRRSGRGEWSGCQHCPASPPLPHLVSVLLPPHPEWQTLESDTRKVNCLLE